MSIADFLRRFGAKLSPPAPIQPTHDPKQEMIDNLHIEIGQLNKELDTCQNKILTITKNDIELENAKKWNTRWNQGKVWYSAREGKIIFDVKTFITKNNSRLKDIIEKDKLVGLTNDDTVFNCMRWVQKHVKYVDDKRNNGFNEQWQFPEETITSFRGDCEDQTILLISLALTAGIKSYRCKAAVGYALPKASDKVNKKAYHCYPVYLRESDNEWVMLDCTWYADQVLIKDRVLGRENPLYAPPDYTFNNEYVWTQHNFIVQRSNAESIKDGEHVGKKKGSRKTKNS